MITKFFKKIYNFIDKCIVVPISRAVYYLSKKFKKNQGKLDKIVNRLGVDTIYNCTYWEIYNQIEDDKKDIKFEKDHIFLTDSLI